MFIAGQDMASKTYPNVTVVRYLRLSKFLQRVAEAISNGDPYIFSFVEPFTRYRFVKSLLDISIIGRDIASQT